MPAHLRVLWLVVQRDGHQAALHKHSRNTAKSGYGTQAAQRGLQPMACHQAQHRRLAAGAHTRCIPSGIACSLHQQLTSRSRNKQLMASRNKQLTNNSQTRGTNSSRSNSQTRGTNSSRSNSQARGTNSPQATHRLAEQTAHKQLTSSRNKQLTSNSQTRGTNSP